MENLLELVGQMREYEREAEEPTLHGFLERIALVSDVDGYDPDKGAISLMTVHTAKGLEFPVVFITGLEERIFPTRAASTTTPRSRRSAGSATSRSRARARTSTCRACGAGGCRGRSCRACRAASCAICPPAAWRRS